MTDKESGYKLPKSYIQYDAYAQSILNIDELTCAVVYDCNVFHRNRLKVTGEILSNNLMSDTLIYIMVYNKNDTLIGCDFNALIRKKTFNGISSFQTAVHIPEGASISKILIRPGANPITA